MSVSEDRTPDRRSSRWFNRKRTSLRIAVTVEFLAASGRLAAGQVRNPATMQLISDHGCTATGNAPKAGKRASGAVCARGVPGLPAGVDELIRCPTSALSGARTSGIGRFPRGEKRRGPLTLFSKIA